MPTSITEEFLLADARDERIDNHREGLEAGSIHPEIAYPFGEHPNPNWPYDKYGYQGDTFFLDHNVVVVPPVNHFDYRGWLPLFRVNANATTSQAANDSFSSYEVPDESEGSPKTTIGNGLKIIGAGDTMDLVGDRIEYDYANHQIKAIEANEPGLRIYGRAVTTDPFSVTAASGMPRGGDDNKKTITLINGGEVTSTSHGFAAGDRVVIRDVVGMTQINNTEAVRGGYVVATTPTSNTLTLKTLDRAITGITKANPGVVTTLRNHRFVTGQTADFGTITGMTALTGVQVTVTVLTLNTFSIGINTTSYSTFTGGTISGRIVPTQLGWSPYTSGGTLQLAASHTGLHHPLWNGDQRSATIQYQHILAPDYFDTGRFSGLLQFLVSPEGDGEEKVAAHVLPPKLVDDNTLPFALSVGRGDGIHYDTEQLGFVVGYTAAVMSFCSSAATVPAGAATYVYATTTNSASDVLGVPVPVNGRIRNLRVVASGNIGSTSAHTWTITVRKNGSDQTLTCTMANAG